MTMAGMKTRGEVVMKAFVQSCFQPDKYTALPHTPMEYLSIQLLPPNKMPMPIGSSKA
jgi:hypothetical protein